MVSSVLSLNLKLVTWAYEVRLYALRPMPIIKTRIKYVKTFIFLKIILNY
jgi:hypothetical protein